MAPWFSGQFVVDFSENGWGGRVKHVSEQFVFYEPFDAEKDQQVRLARLDPKRIIFYRESKDARAALKNRFSEAPPVRQGSGYYGDREA